MDNHKSIPTPKPNSSMRDKYYLPIDGCLHEVSEQVYKAFYKEQNREEYLAKRDEGRIVSYNALDTEHYTGEAFMQDLLDSSPEEKAISKEMCDCLHRCIALLPRQDRHLIQSLYFDGLTETEYAQLIKMTISGVSRRRDKILSKLRTLLTIYGSFLFFVKLDPFFYLISEGAFSHNLL